MINLYTQAQVQTAILRAQVAMLLISQKISSSFLYLNTYMYNLYKNLQYDIYGLYAAVNNEIGFIGFADNPNTYEQQFYGLVGSMIEKTVTVDFTGAYGGSLNANYQNPALVINITTTGSNLESGVYQFTGQTTISLSNYQATYYPLYGNTPYVQIFVSDGAGGFTPDSTTAPDYTYNTTGNPASGITSITWTYPVSTNGYILISGVKP